MNLNNIDISKLPADIRRQYKQLQVLHAEKKIQNKAKDDFLSFVNLEFGFNQKACFVENFLPELIEALQQTPGH